MSQTTPLMLVTGADGEQGRVVVAGLQGAYRVRAVVGSSVSGLTGAEVRVGDVRDRAFVETLLDGVAAVVHLAPLTAPITDELEALDQAARGTYVLLTSALDAGISRLVLGSSLTLFDALPATWQVTASWRPRPQPTIAQLCVWLAELSAREVGRASGAAITCLRFGVTDANTTVAAVTEALAAGSGWAVRHVGVRPPSWPPIARTVASRPIRTVVVFGAGGPLAAATVAELAPSYRLRLTDIRPLAEVAAAGPRRDQHSDAPVPSPLGPPHEERLVDVTDPAAVLAACEGADAIINCTVVREHPVAAFHVNLGGAYTIVRAAVASGIRRIVHTGPQLLAISGEHDYAADYDVPEDAPPRPGRHLYGHSKYLGQELCRVFAHAYGLEIPALVFSDFVQPNNLPDDLYPMSVSWADAARSVRAALEVAELPSPFEVFTISADLPHAVFSNRKAKHVLGWFPRDRLFQ